MKKKKNFEKNQNFENLEIPNNLLLKSNSEISNENKNNDFLEDYPNDNIFNMNENEINKALLMPNFGE